MIERDFTKRSIESKWTESRQDRNDYGRHVHPRYSDTANFILPSYEDYWEKKGWLRDDRGDRINDILCDGYRRYTPMLIAHLQRMDLHADIAEDRRQEVFFKWWQCLETGQNLPVPPALLTWLRTLASRMAVNYIRRLPSREAEGEYAIRTAGRHTRKTGLAVDREKLMHKAELLLMTRGTKRMWQIVSLYTDREHTCPQIAKQLGIGLALVHQYLRWAWQILREEMREELLD